MNFLEKFKGKTQMLKKDQVNQILGEKTLHVKKNQNNNQLHLLSISQSPQKIKKEPNKQQISNKATNTSTANTLTKSQVTKNNSKNTEVSPPKKIIQNPFLVQNQFFLDENEHQNILKRRKQQEIKERLQKQKKKRQQIQQKLMQSIKGSPKISQKFKKKQWIKLGGLGANIGGQEWTKKKILQQKMLKFSQQINKVNMQKLQVIKSPNLRYNKSMTQKSKQKNIDSPSMNKRKLAISYSKSIPKPTFYTLQKTKYNKSEMRTYNSDFQSPLPRLGFHSNIQPQQSNFNHGQNEFSNLKLQRDYSQLQRLQNKHLQFKNLIYHSNF